MGTNYSLREYSVLRDAINDDDDDDQHHHHHHRVSYYPIQTSRSDILVCIRQVDSRPSLSDRGRYIQTPYFNWHMCK